MALRSVKASPTVYDFLEFRHLSIESIKIAVFSIQQRSPLAGGVFFLVPILEKSKHHKG